MTTEKTSQSLPLPATAKEFIIAFIRALKAGRLYSSAHAIFKDNVKRLYDQFHLVREGDPFFFVGFARDSLLLRDEFFQASDVHSRDFLNLFHSLGISHLLMQKDITVMELGSLVETLAGAKSGQGQEVTEAIHRENVEHIDLGFLDYSIFSGVEHAVSHFVHERKEAVLWRQLILRPAIAGSYLLKAEDHQELLRLSEDLALLKQTVAELDRDLKNHVKGISFAQRGKIIGNFLQNSSKSISRINKEMRRKFTDNVNLLLQSFHPQIRLSILGSVPPDSSDEDDKGVIQDLIDGMPPSEMITMLVKVLIQEGAGAGVFKNLFQRTFARFKDTEALLALVRSEMNRATQERRQDILNGWQHLEQILIHRQQSEDFNNQYQKAIEDLASSIKLDKAMIEEEEMERITKTLVPDSLKLFKTRLVIDLLEEPHRSDASTLPLLQAMGDAVKYFLGQGRQRVAGNLLRQLYLSMGQHPQKALFQNEANSWLVKEDVSHLLNGLFEKCRTYQPREMAAISSICQLFPEKTGGFLIDLYVKTGDQQTALGDWLMTTLASIGASISRVLGSRIESASDVDLPALLDLADLIRDQQLAPALERLLSHKDHRVLSQAIGTLGRLRSERSVPPLAQIVLRKAWFNRKKDRLLRMEALMALAQIRTEEAKAVIQRVATTESGELQRLSRDILEKP